MKTSTNNHHKFKLWVLLLSVAVVGTTLPTARVSAGSVPTESTIVLQTADAMPLQGTFQVVNNGPGDQTNPLLECGLVSYTNDDFEGRSTIHYHDLSTNADKVIPGDDVDLLSDVSGS